MFCCPHCSMLSTILFTIVEPDLDSTILLVIVDNHEQFWQRAVVQLGKNLMFN